MVGVPAQLAVPGEHIRSPGHPAAAAQRGQDVHSGRQELEGDHEESPQVPQLYQVGDTPWSVPTPYLQYKIADGNTMETACEINYLCRKTTKLLLIYLHVSRKKKKL